MHEPDVSTSSVGCLRMVPLCRNHFPAVCRRPPPFTRIDEAHAQTWSPSNSKLPTPQHLDDHLHPFDSGALPLPARRMLSC